MCRVMDINYYHKQHEKIRQQFRHDAIMREIKKRQVYTTSLRKCLHILAIIKQYRGNNERQNKTSK